MSCYSKFSYFFQSLFHTRIFNFYFQTYKTSNMKSITRLRLFSSKMPKQSLSSKCIIQKVLPSPKTTLFFSTTSVLMCPMPPNAPKIISLNSKTVMHQNPEGHYERNFITAVRAMNDFLLKPEHLNGLRVTYRRSPNEQDPILVLR